MATSDYLLLAQLIAGSRAWWQPQAHKDSIAGTELSWVIQVLWARDTKKALSTKL